jgi:hypothetical protein
MYGGSRVQSFHHTFQPLKYLIDINPAVKKRAFQIMNCLNWNALGLLVINFVHCRVNRNVGGKRAGLAPLPYTG